MRRFAHSTCFLVSRLLLSDGWNREGFLDCFTAFTFTFLETWLCVFLSPNYRGYYQPFSCAGEPRFSSWGKCLHKFQSCRSTSFLPRLRATALMRIACLSVYKCWPPANEWNLFSEVSEWMKSRFCFRWIHLSFNPSPVDFSQLIPTTHAWESPIFFKEKKEKNWTLNTTVDRGTTHQLAGRVRGHLCDRSARTRDI